jgi:hypothetical protein
MKGVPGTHFMDSTWLAMCAVVVETAVEWWGYASPQEIGIGCSQRVHVMLEEAAHPPRIAKLSAAVLPRSHAAQHFVVVKFRNSTVRCRQHTR